MRKFFTLFALCLSALVFAQNKVAEKVGEFKALNAYFTHFSVLTAVNQPTDNQVSRAVTKSTIAHINTAAVNDIVANKYQTIELEIPYMGNTVLVELYKVDLLNQNFHLDSDKAKNIQYQPGVYYRGIVKDDPNSIASFNFFNNELNGIVSAAGMQNLVIGKLDKPNNNTDYIVYCDADMRVPSGFNCSVKEDTAVPEHDQDTQRQTLTERCVTMYFEIDYDLFQSNGSNTTTTNNWMTSVFNNVATLYALDDITVALKSVYIWTEQDPYEGVGDASTDYLYLFHETRPVFDGDVGQLIGIDEGGLGGVAVAIDGLCSQNNFSYSDVNFAFSTVPTYSWTVQVITHEMGHLLGSRHTHACVWNGDNTSIDGCGTQAGYSEGNCVLGPIPSGTEKGTIMSYCHLIAGVGIGLNNGFGPQPKAAIINAVESSACLSTDCLSTCINLITDISIVSTSTTSTTISWNDMGSATSWEVSVSPFGSTVIDYVTVTEPTYTYTTPLTANTYYKVRVRPVCDGSTANYRQELFATPANWCSGVTITDTGGISNDYTDNQSYVRTIIPNLPQKSIRLTFTAFDLEADYDFLTIYDGANTSAPSLGDYTGDFIVSPVQSSSPDGAMTLKFFSDEGVTAAGYVASVTCQQNLGVHDVGQNIDFTYYPNPAKGSVNITSNTEIEEILVYNPQGRLLYQSKNDGLDKKVDISAFATGTYFFKLKFGDKEANFKIIKE